MPARLEAIRPRKSPAYDLAAFNAALEAALQATADEMIKDFERTTATWRHKPEFRVFFERFRVGSRDVSIAVGTDDEIYGYVSRGTRPHLIAPKNGTVLRFNSGFIAKTKPGRFLSGAGGSGGSPVFAKAVMHPGTKPRKFEELVQKKHQQRGTLQKNIQSRWDKLVKG